MCVLKVDILPGKFEAPTLKHRACAQNLASTDRARTEHGWLSDRADLGFPYCDSPCVRRHCFDNPLSKLVGKNVKNVTKLLPKMKPKSIKSCF